MKRELGERGVVAVIVAICLIMLMAIAALVVDVGYSLTARVQLQDAADAAALAGTAYLDGTLNGITTARNQAIAYAAKNRAAGDAVDLLPEDIEFGYWDMPTKDFNPIPPGAAGYPGDINAMRITARRETDSGTGLATTFGKVFGQNTINVRSEAVAQRGGPSQCLDTDDPATDCNLDIPLVLCRNKVTTVGGSAYCGVEITVGSTPSQSGMVTSYFENSSTPNILSYIDGDTPNVYARPCSQCPVPPRVDDRNAVEATQGAGPPVFAALRRKWEEKVAPCLANGSGPSCEYVDGRLTWKTFVAVVCVECDTPSMTSGPACIVGFARVNIEEVCTAQGNTPCQRTQQTRSSTNAIYGFLKCGENTAAQNTGSGGGNFGTFSPNPGLVQ